MKKLFLFLFLIGNSLIAQERKVVINECMPNNSNTAADQDGEYNDWLELYNISNTSINLNGYFLSDRKSMPTKFRFPNVSISANDYLIIWVDKDSTQNSLHTNFKLSASSEQVYLFNPDTNLIDYVHFYNMQADESIARTTDGNGPFKVMNPSFNSSNGSHSAGLVINEWMAWNANEEMDEYGEYNDWIELYNNSNQNINLNGYFLSNKANEATKYQFPNITLNSNEYLVLWADEDTLQGTYHLPFKLDSERDDIILSRPDTSTIDYFFHHNVDSNLTMARIPNGIGNINIGVSTLATSNQSHVSIIENVNPNFSIHPNPCVNYITVENNDRSSYFEIININGVFVESFSYLGNKFNIDLTSYIPGMYYIRDAKGNCTSFIISDSK